MNDHSSDSIPVVFATDHNYVMPTGVAIHSLLKSKEAYIIYVIIGEDVVLEDKELLIKEVKTNSSNCEIHFIESGDTFKNSYICRHISRLTYSRLLIPWLLPQYDKIIYCDQDIIFKTHLYNLYHYTDLKNSYVAGVRRRYKENSIYFNHVKKIGLDPDNYINAGFLIINSRKMREEQNLLSEFKKLSKHEFLSMDQDILNLVCKDKIKYLPQRFNVTPEIITQEILEKECIIHYSGEKPWETFKICWLEWWENYKESVFYESEFYLSFFKKINVEIKKGQKARIYMENAGVLKSIYIIEKFQKILNKVPFIKNIVKKILFRK